MLMTVLIESNESSGTFNHQLRASMNVSRTPLDGKEAMYLNGAMTGLVKSVWLVVSMIPTKYAVQSTYMIWSSRYARGICREV